MQKIFLFIGILTGIFLIIFVGFSTLLPKQFLSFDTKSEDSHNNSIVAIRTPSIGTVIPVASSSPEALPKNGQIGTTPVLKKQNNEIRTVVTEAFPIKKTIQTATPLIVTKSPPPPSTLVMPPLVLVNATTTATSSSDSQNDLSIPSGVGALNQRDILALTNKERVQQGLRVLTFNTRLAAMAEAKARDMIDNQYFAHVSPSGIDIVMLTERYGYAYLNVGENLALGDFVSSQEVVTGWMNSPGHRANILNKSYTELGVAAIIGAYNGRNVWFVVQEFGRPMSDCPTPDALLKQKITISQEQINALEVTLANLKIEINTAGLSIDAYNAKVNDYNTIVALYNNLVATAKKQIADYNILTDAYNLCITTP